MQFKALAFLSILSILFFAGCDSKNKSEKEKVEKVETSKSNTEFKLKTTLDTSINIKLEDDKIIIKEHTDKIVILSFFATWCPACKVEIANLNQLQQSYKNDIVVISVLLEEMKTKEEILAFKEEHNINYIITNGPEVIDLAKGLGGIKSIPTMYLLDKDRKIFQKYVGIVPNQMMDIDIKKILGK